MRQEYLISIMAVDGYRICLCMRSPKVYIYIFFLNQHCRLKHTYLPVSFTIRGDSFNSKTITAMPLAVSKSPGSYFVLIRDHSNKTVLHHDKWQTYEKSGAVVR